MQPLKGGAGDERTAVRHSGRPQQLVSSFPSLRLLVFFTSSVLLLMLRSTFFLPRLMLFKWRTSYFSFPAVHMLSAVLRWSTQLVTQTALTAAAFVRYTWTPFIIQRTQTKWLFAFFHCVVMTLQPSIPQPQWFLTSLSQLSFSLCSLSLHPQQSVAPFYFVFSFAPSLPVFRATVVADEQFLEQKFFLFVFVCSFFLAFERTGGTVTQRSLYTIEHKQ